MIFLSLHQTRCENMTTCSALGILPTTLTIYQHTVVCKVSQPMRHGHLELTSCINSIQLLHLQLLRESTACTNHIRIFNLLICNTKLCNEWTATSRRIVDRNAQFTKCTYKYKMSMFWNTGLNKLQIHLLLFTLLSLPALILFQKLFMKGLLFLIFVLLVFRFDE